MKTPPRLLRFTRAGWLAAALALLALPCQAFDLSSLMGELAQHTHGKAKFTETKYVALLDKPLRSSGELAFTAPDKLEKRTLTPKPEMLLLDGNIVTLEQGGRSMRVQLERYPQVMAFVGAIRGLLTGNQREIEQYYKTQLSGTEEQWSLQLSPLNARMSEVVQSIKMSGSRHVVRQIEYEQRDGDRSVMQIEPMSEK